jgi:hypothetical protein
MPNVEDEKDTALLKGVFDCIAKFRLALHKKRLEHPGLADEAIDSLEALLLEAMTDLSRIDRERSERRKSEADTVTDGIPYKGGHRSE